MYVTAENIFRAENRVANIRYEDFNLPFSLAVFL